MQQFRRGKAMRLLQTAKVRSATAQSYRIATTSRAALSGMYDAEYAGNAANYAYLNLLLCPGGIERVIGSPALYLNDHARFLDVGTGSGELLRYLHRERHVGRERLHGCDLSLRSCEIVRRDGFQAHLGRLEEVSLGDNAFEVIFLSYFVDYDTDQGATFDAAVRGVRKGGIIVFEGCLPSRPWGLLKEDRSMCHFITRGVSEAEDAELICRYIRRSGDRQGKPISNISVLGAERYLYNRRGLRKLPSTFISISF